MGQVVIKDFTNSRVLDRLMMYERRLENSLYKTMRQLQSLRVSKKLDTIAPAKDEQTTAGLEKKMQNEPNFKNIEMHSNHVHKRDYEQLLKFSRQKNEPNLSRRSFSEGGLVST